MEGNFILKIKVVARFLATPAAGRRIGHANLATALLHDAPNSEIDKGTEGNANN
jgi:hypothetical protein